MPGLFSKPDDKAAKSGDDPMQAATDNLLDELKGFDVAESGSEANHVDDSDNN